MNTRLDTQLDKPLLSVLIPTKNRPYTAIEAIAIAVKVSSGSNIQVVVQDCSDDNKLEQIISELDLRDSVLYSKSSPVSMTENWNNGLALTSGEYVTIIGDDDTILPGIVDVALWAREHGHAAVGSENQSWYGWPDFPDKSVAGKLCLRSFTGSYDLRAAQSSLQKFSGTGDEYRELPGIYHGLVKRTVLEKIRANTGQYLDSLSPDMYSAYAVALNVESYVLVNYPMTIVGASGHSNWGRNTRDQGRNTRESNTHLSEFKQFQFTSLAPSSHHLWSQGLDCMVRAFINTNRTDMFRFVDFERVFARTIVAEPLHVVEHTYKFARAMRSLGRNVPLAILNLAGNVVGKLALKHTKSSREMKKTTPGEWYSDIRSISQAVEIQQRSIAHRNPVPTAANLVRLIPRA